jgi:hypothetical protein
MESTIGWRVRSAICRKRLPPAIVEYFSSAGMVLWLGKRWMISIARLHEAAVDDGGSNMPGGGYLSEMLQTMLG